MIRAWLRRRRRQTGRVAGLLLLVAELERDVAARDRHIDGQARRIAYLQHALAPYVTRDPRWPELIDHMLRPARERARAAELEPTVVLDVDRTEQYRRPQR